MNKLNGLLSVLKIKKSYIKETRIMGSKVLIETKNNPKGKYGGYSHYFSNLARGKYKDNPQDKYEGWGGTRTLKFLVKYISTCERILSHKRPIRILDIGCSSGFLRRILEANIFSTDEIYYYGIDIRKHVLEKAVFDKLDLESGAQGDNIKSLYINYDVREGLPFKANTFDFVVSFEMTKYLTKRDVKNLFKEISRTLQSKGLFIYSCGGMGNNKQQRDQLALRWKTKMSSFWYTKELKSVLEKRDLHIEKTYAAETSFNSIKNNIRVEDKNVFWRMNGIYPQELIQAILGPFYPESTQAKLFIIRKGKPDFRKEIQIEFSAKTVKELQHAGNCKVFLADGKIAKYIPQNLFFKNLNIYNLLFRQTKINLPNILEIRESVFSESYIMMMDNKGKTVAEIWNTLTIQQRDNVIKEIVIMLKEIHSIHFNPKRTPQYLRLHTPENTNLYYPAYNRFSSKWQNDIYTYCRDWLKYSSKHKWFRTNICKKLLEVLNENINYINEDDYSLLLIDPNFNNFAIDKSFHLSLLCDFETANIGNKYLDVAIITSFLLSYGEHYQNVFVKSYGVPENFYNISKVFRLFLLLNTCQAIKKALPYEYENELMSFIEGTGTFSFHKWFK